MVELEVFLPGEDAPIDLVDYATAVSIQVVVEGNSANVPSTFILDNPKDGDRVTIRDD